MSDRDPAEMHVARGAPGRTYARLDANGTLFLIANGKGLSVHMDATELRRFAGCALTVADTLEQREQAAGQTALVALARAIS